MKQLKIKNILAYYDVPQLFVAVDTFNVQYLCLLYDISNDGELKIIGISVSDDRLNEFIDGGVDLLSLFKFPENVFYNIYMTETDIYAEQFDGIPDDSMLPDKDMFL